MSYASLDDVAARTPYRSITEATKPTGGQVGAWITETEAILNGALAAAGILPAAPTDEANAILRSWVVDRVSGLLRMAYAAAGGDGANQDGKDLVEKFDKLLEEIDKNPGLYGAMLFAGEAPIGARRFFGDPLDNNRDETIEAGDFSPQFTKKAGINQF